MRVKRFTVKPESVIGLVVVMLCLDLNACSGKPPETSTSAHQPVTESPAAAVIAAEKLYAEAYLHRDWKAAAVLLAPDYYVNAEGVEGDFAKLKEEFPKIQLFDYQVLSEPRVKSLAPDLALYNDTETMRETYAGRDISGHYWHGDIWVRRNGRWLLLVEQEGRLREGDQ